MKNKIYISFTEETYNSLVSANCPTLAAKFNARGSSTYTDENEEEVTTNWDYTWAELCEKNKWVPNVRWFYPTQIVSEELLDEEGVGTGVFADVEKYVTQTIPAPTEEDPNATTEEYVRKKIFIVGLPELSLLGGEIAELVALGNGMNPPYNTVMIRDVEVSSIIKGDTTLLAELYANTVKGKLFNVNADNLP